MVQRRVSQLVSNNFFLNSLRIRVLVISTHMQKMKVGFRVGFGDIGFGTQENIIKRPKIDPGAEHWLISQLVSNNFF